jgi:hypothetical protein
LVKLDREKRSRRQFEEVLKEEFIEDCTKSSKVDTSVCDDKEVVFPAHDFEDVEQFLPAENESEESEGGDSKQQNEDQDLTENESEDSDDDSE